MVALLFPVLSYSNQYIWCISWNSASLTGNKSLSKFAGFKKVSKNDASKILAKFNKKGLTDKYGLKSMVKHQFIMTDTLHSHLLSGKDIRCGCYIYQPSSGSRGWSTTQGDRNCYTLQKASDMFDKMRSYK